MEKKKLSKGFLYAFGLGDFGFQVMVQLELAFFMVFMTDALRMAPEKAGVIVTVTSLFDVIWVLAAGLIVQKVNFRRGKLRTWLLFSPPIIWALFVLEYWGFSGNSGLTTFFIYMGFILSHLIWNCCYTAHIAMISAYSDNVGDQTVLSSRRAVGQSAGRMAFSAIALPLILFFGKSTGNAALGYTFAAMIITIPMAIGYWIVYVVSKPYEGTTDANVPAPKLEKVPLRKNIITSLKNSQFLVLMLTDLGRCFAFYLVTATTAYYFNVVIGDITQMTLFLLGVNGISVLSALIAPFVAKPLGRKNTYFLCLMCYGIALLFVYFLGGTLPIFVLFMLIANVFGQIAYSMVTAMYADTVVYGEWKTGVNSRGFIMGLFSLPIKGSIFIRSAFMGIMLTSMAYAPGVRTPQMVDGVRSMVAFAPAVVLLFFGIVGFLLYKLSDKRVVEITKELSKRNMAAKPALKSE